MDEELSVHEAAFLEGFMDASSLTARKSPYRIGSIEDAEYQRGYSRSMEETDI